MSLKTAIVDDEPLARDLLRLLLARHADIEIVAECQNGREAVACLQSAPPLANIDLLFLDVEMPGASGFEVVEQIGLKHLPPTIFVTAYQKHAVRAFEVNAIDYLTKPVEPERLSVALQRVREKIAARGALLTQAQLEAVLQGLKGAGDDALSHVTRFLVKDGAKEILLPADKIDWVEAAEYYCCLHSGGRRYMLRETISELSRKLDSGRFVRIHRSSIVNLDRIREIYREGQSEGSIVLADGQRLKMSKAGRQKLVEIGKR
jgi:two-component system, LytTR family, response regulator